LTAGSLALFAVVLSFLALQLRAGRDPALGAGPPPAPKRVLVKRVENRVVVERVVGEEADEGDDSGGSSAVTSVAAAPTPAPAPAPVTTRSS
jgi:hypothetical protein